LVDFPINTKPFLIIISHLERAVNEIKKRKTKFPHKKPSFSIVI